MAPDTQAYREYVIGNMDRLRRTAYLLCGDWHTADDLVSVTLAKLYRVWRRASEAEHTDAYVRKMLVRAWLAERRRGWFRREEVRWDPPERASPSQIGTMLDRATLDELLRSLPEKRRAVLVLRYFCDLTVEQTADALGCSPGTVKSQTSRALDTLRGHLSETSTS